MLTLSLHDMRSMGEEVMLKRNGRRLGRITGRSQGWPARKIPATYDVTIGERDNRIIEHDVQEHEIESVTYVSGAYGAAMPCYHPEMKMRLIEGGKA